MRYVRLFAQQLRASLLLSMQYRFDFVLDGVSEIAWMATALIPLTVAFGLRETVAGWSFGEALMVMGWFALLEGVLEGAIEPSLTTVVEHVRRGTLDFVLLKPADAQFLVSTAQFRPWRAVNVLTAIGFFAYGFHVLGRAPAASDLALALVALLAAIAVLYSLWIVAVSAALVVVRVDNLVHLFESVFDAARWPSSVFRGALRILFTFVIPLALMTTVPAEALLGKARFATIAASLAGGALALLVSRALWTAAIRRYTSAGG